MSAAVLEGVRIIEIAHERSLFAGKLLADMGADVVLVEPPGGAPMRAYPPFAENAPAPERSLYWWHYNTSKRAITLDLESERGRELFLDLAAGAEIVLESEDPGRLAALGLDHPDLCARKPDLIVASMTPFGRTTSRRDELATDLTLLAGGGPVWSCGYDDHLIPPVRGGGNQGYQTGCHYMVLSILTAYFHKLVRGEGQHLDISMHAAANVTTEMSSYHWLVQRGTVQRQTGRHALEDPSMPTQILCADGRYACTGVPPRKPAEFGKLHEWLVRLGVVDQLPEAIFLERGAEREDFDMSKILEDDELMAIYGAAREGLNLAAASCSAYDFFIGAQEIGIAVGAIYSPEETLEDPHFVARGFPVAVEHEELGRAVTYAGAPYVFGKSPWRISCRAPHLGEHNAEIFGELGIDADELGALGSGGIV